MRPNPALVRTVRLRRPATQTREKDGVRLGMLHKFSKVPSLTRFSFRGHNLQGGADKYRQAAR